jgi:hypothetical protein
MMVIRVLVTILSLTSPEAVMIEDLGKAQRPSSRRAEPYTHPPGLAQILRTIVIPDIPLYTRSIIGILVSRSHLPDLVI